MLCGQAKSLGRLIEAYIGIVGTGAQPGRRYLVYVENRVQLPLRTEIGCLKQLLGCGSGEQCSKLATVRGEMSNPQA